MTAVDLSRDDDLLAAELALGFLADEERAAAEARTTDEPEFARAYNVWQERAAGMLRDTDATPRPSLWIAIKAAIPANDDQSASRPAQSTVRWWQGGTAIASAAAIVLGFVAFDRPSPLAPQAAVFPERITPPLVAMLSSDSGRAVVAVSFDQQSGRLTIVPAKLDTGRHVPQLWVIAPGETPRSLGVITSSVLVWTPAPSSAVSALAPGATLAISIEPIGGSPTGQPTGPIILKGIIGTV